MLGVSLWKALCRKIAQTEEKRNGDRAFTSVRKAIREIPSSKGKMKVLIVAIDNVNNIFFYLLQILQIIHTVEECPDTLAFATEPVLASLANILAFYVSQSFD